MKNASRTIGSALLGLFFAVATQAGVDLVFQDSFESCLEGNRARWNGQGDGVSWWDPDNWIDDQVPADNDAVWITGGGGVTVTFGNSQGAVNIFCLLSNKSITVSAGTLNIADTSSISGDLTLTGGTLGVARSLGVSGAMQHSNGTLSGVGTVTVQGLYDWTGGSQTGTGETVAGGGLTLSGSGHKVQDTRTVTLAGASTWIGSGDWRVYSGAVINNNISLDIQKDGLVDHRVGALSTFNNNGSLAKSAGAGTLGIETHFNNSGSVTATSGTLSMGSATSSGSSVGTFEAGSGATLALRGTQTMQPASSFSGAGGVAMVSGGTTVIQGAYTVSGGLAVSGGGLTFDTAPASLGSVDLSGGTLTATSALNVSGAMQHSNGTLSGVGTVTVQGLYDWTGGSQTGTGETVAGGGLTLSGSGHKVQDTRTVTLAGASTWIGSGDWRVYSGAVINNNISLDIQKDGLVDHRVGALSTFNNNGSLAKSAGAGTLGIETHFNNSGSVTATSGTLSMGSATSSGSSVGTFEAGSGATLALRGTQTMQPASSFSGAGGVAMVSGGTTVIQGAYTVSGGLAVSGGGLTFDTAPASLGSVDLSGGTLTATSALNVSGAMQHSNGTLSGVGTVTVQGLYDWTGGSQTGTGETVAGGGLTLSGSGHKVQDTRTVTLAGASTWAGSGDWRVYDGATINNNISLDIQTDAFLDHRTGAYSTFNNNGSLARSASTGTTLIEANFNSSGTIGVRIADGSFDSFTITQAVTLDGTLNISLEGGYQPAPPASFQVMSFGSRAGTFTTVNGVSIGNGNEFDPVYGAADLTLEVVPE